VGSIKRVFEQMSAIVVTVFLFYFLFFIKVQKEIIYFFRECWMFFWAIVKGSPASILLFSFLALLLLLLCINCILEKDEDINVKKDVKKRKKKKNKIEKKIEKKEEALQG